MTTTSNSNSGLDAKEKGAGGSLEDMFGPVIHSYSRADAIEDGYMVAVDAAQSRPFFTIPVALTRTVWDSIVERGGDSDAARAMHLASLLSCAERAANGAKDESLVSFVYTAGGDAPINESLFLLVGPADTAAHVITIMQPSDL